MNKENNNQLDVSELKFNEKGLIPAIVQDEKSGDVLMIAYMNKESVQITLDEKRTCFYSRSRQKLWRKGETSGHIQKVKSIYYDCDKDALLVIVDQEGGACHTGNWSCFYRKLI
ncbi:MAG: phosphoribosyl-AMP cyclohydrolase [Candidatus Omnitrophica bacterium]|nr:phosphoribosyl-AMP cyclohydrolase [Candidatus Omnitrophota bacterium]MCF7893885.1 phosphoribosyl-AMP cyclohydrolase [Candidatus Omnitrophota bacterium]